MLSFKPAEPPDRQSPEIRKLLAATITALVNQGMSRKQARSQARQAMARTMNDRYFLSDDYQVAIRALDPDVLHISVKRRDREVLLSRYDLVEIATRFAPKGTIPVELYVGEARVVDTANQYHVFTVPEARAPWGTGAALVDRILSPTPTSMLPGRWVCHVHESGRLRDWREIQLLKNRLFGESAEAMDVLLPETAELGPCLLHEPGTAIPLGFQSGFRTEQSIGKARQRPFGDQQHAGAVK